MGLINFNPINKKISVGGRSFIVSALPCGVVRYQLWPLSDDLAQGRKTIDEVLDDMLLHVVASVSVAEPDLTREDLLEGLLLSDITGLFQDVCRVSGLRRSDEGTPSEGEALSSESTGLNSTGS
jgi:hypothetical protein